MSTNRTSQPRDREDYGIAILCAVGVEANTMIALLDNVWEEDEQYEKADGDTNSYTFGRIGQHHVVLAHIPRIGKVSASTVAAYLRSSFPNVRLSLLVGTCGAVPLTPDKREILLGDIIISTHIVQSDFGRLYEHAFTRKTSLQDNLGRPGQEIAGLLSKLKGKVAQSKLKGQIRTNLATLHNSPEFSLSKYPGTQEDKLFESTYWHRYQDTKASVISASSSNSDDCHDPLELSCTELGCDLGKLISRDRIRTMAEMEFNSISYTPDVHFGGMASANQSVDCGLHRDQIAEQEGVIAFEMEGAGIWDTIPTIVVKGVCDYADSHKSKCWQPYASATAAACAKGILAAWRKTGRTRDKETALPPTQDFSGTFSAGRNIHNGGTYTAESISF